MTHIQIKSRFSDKILFEGEYNSTKDALEEAVKKRANICGANLRDANLRNANLRGADLLNANLWGANLRNANLWGANLWGANLRNANLRGADLWGADLWGADLWGADLCGADLCGADLCGANLWGADLRGEKLKIAPLMMQLSRWDVLITPKYMKIGCERHTHNKWANFKRTDISKMDTKAWDWWQEHKDMLLMACAIHKKQADAITESEDI